VRDRGAAVSVPEAGGWYNLLMTRLLEQVVKDLRTLSLEEQDRVAEVVATYLNGSQEDLRLVA
jgi:tRNA uridine 5-carbamoylmethylation protein Kti12